MTLNINIELLKDPSRVLKRKQRSVSLGGLQRIELLKDPSRVLKHARREAAIKAQED